MKHCGLLCVAGLWLASGLAQAGQDAEPLRIGTLRRIHSDILKEDRMLSIRVPDSYEQTRLSYPVIYLLYADQTEGYFAETVFALERLEGGAEIPEFLLVGIHNTDRYGNLLPVHFTGQSGGADTFMRFLEKELIPFIETGYRAKPYRLLIGPQAGGPFGLYALARRPALFHAFILENPFSAPACRDVLQSALREFATGPPGARASVFINSFDRTGFQDHSEANQFLTDFLKRFDPIKPAGLRIWRRQLEQPTFVPSLELKQPLRELFPGFYPPEEKAVEGLADIVAYYREAGRRLGFEVEPPALLLSVKSDVLSMKGRTAAAREILDYALGLRPHDTNAMLRMGNLLFNSGELTRAEEFFRRLQAIRPDPLFAGRLETIRRALKGSAAHALSEALQDGLPVAKTRLSELEKSADPNVYFDERELNALGYRLLAQNQVDQAVFIFELNARRSPDSWNVHDSLGEAYARAGRIEDAIRSYEKSLRLNPNNQNAKTMLEKLRR
jgi:tetratricopeptide (TPR) repeat protein